jgi:hypothetical protein
VIAAIEKLGGRATVDGNKAVVAVHFRNREGADAGLVHLKELTELKSLSLGTQVTDAGVEKLKQALPKCKIGY